MNSKVSILTFYTNNVQNTNTYFTNMNNFDEKN